MPHLQLDLFVDHNQLHLYLLFHRYVDPNDPTRIFLQQPTPESELRRRTYHAQPGDNAY